MSDSPDEQPLRAVVVGTGFGVITHLRALRAAGIEVVGLVGRDPEKTRERATGAGVPRGLTSLTEAFALPHVDLVSVATPPHSHGAIVLEAVAAGKHVMCEKPFATNLAEARAMLEAAEKAGVLHLLGTEFRFATGQALATRAIHDGVIGEPRMASFILQMPALADPAAEVPAWWSDAGEGGGWLGAYASHVIDQVRVTLGEIAGLSASLSLVSDRGWTAEDSYSIHFRTVTGVDGILQSSAASWGPPLMASRISGTKGTLSIQGNDVVVADREGTRTLEVPEDLKLPAPVPPPGELLHTTYDMLHSMGIDLAPYTRLFEVMGRRIRGLDVAEDPAVATFVDGVAGQAVLDAIRQSNAERCWVALDG
jgi:predicted dehydrogenase